MAEQISLSNGIVSVLLSTKGAELKSVKRGNKEYLWEGDPAVWPGQAPLMFPICGGLKDDKFIYEGKEYILEKHGFARHYEFELVKKTDSTASFLLKNTEEMLEVYPFMFELYVSYALTQNRVEIRYDVKNTNDKDMYFSIGGHEGYACHGGIENYSIIFDKPETLNAKVLNGNLLEYKTVPILENATELPLKKSYFAVDALVFTDVNSRKVTLKNNITKEEMAVEFGGFDYLILWTKPSGEYICIEPWCGIPDFVDSDYSLEHKRGINLLEVGKVFTRTHSMVLGD